MSISNSKPPFPNDEGPTCASPDDEAKRKQDTSGAADFAVEFVANGAEIVVDGIGTVVSSVVSSLGDLG